MIPRHVSGALLVLMGLVVVQPAGGQTTSFDTILSTTCDGTFRLFPDNQLANVNINAPFLPRMFGKFVDGLRTYLRAQCGSYYSDAEFDARFDIGRFILTGNKWFNGKDTRSDACYDNPETFTRDGYKMYEAIFTNQLEYDMPSTCNWDTWDKNGTCALEYAMHGMVDVNFQIRVERCSRLGGGFPRVSIGCSGKGCSVFTPCTSSSSCGPGQVCTDIVDLVGEDKLKSIFTSIGYYGSTKTATDPRILIEKVIAAFGNLFPGGVTTGASVCLPEAVKFYRAYNRMWYQKLFGNAWGSNTLDNAELSHSDCNNVTKYSWWYGPYTVTQTTRYVLTWGVIHPWNGLVNGTSPFEPKANWVTFPNTVRPVQETHIASVQCDGLIHLFSGTAFPIRIYHPKLIEMLGFWTENNMGAYPISDLDTYYRSMAIWRVEPYLYTMMPGSDKTSFGNIVNIFHPRYFFNIFAEGMNILDYNNWVNNKALDISLRPNNATVFGSDFKVNVRTAQCAGQQNILTSAHVTCVGNACDELLLKKTCTSNTDCVVGTCQTLKGYYDNDEVAQILWGYDDLGVPAPWAGNDAIKCPAGSTPGKNYRKLTTSQPVRGMLSGVWVGLQFADCANRAADKCVAECAMNGADCVPTNGMPPTWDSDRGFCYPEIGNFTEGSVYVVTKGKGSEKSGITFQDISVASQAATTSEEVVVDPFPEPTRQVEPPHEIPGMETILTGSCDGQFRLFPENELLAISIDAQIVPRAFGEYMKTVSRYVTSRCEAKGKTPPDLNNPTGRFMKRFHPLNYAFFSGEVDEYDACLDDADTFVRDFVKMFKDNKMFQQSLFLPDTCNNVTWIEQGSCKMRVAFPLFPDTDFTVNIERCDNNFGYPRFAIGCRGGGCNSMGTPCNDDTDCGGNSQCIDPIQEIGAANVTKFFRDTLHFLSPQTTQSNAVQEMFNDFITQFGPYFTGNPITALGNKKVCFAKEYITSPRNQERVPPVVANYEMNQELCGLPGSTWNRNPAGYCDEETNNVLFYPDVVDPASLPGAGGVPYKPNRYGTYGLVRGLSVTDTFNNPVMVGGGKCTTHADCSTGSGDIMGLCVTGEDMYHIASNCDEVKGDTEFRCACSMGPSAINPSGYVSYYNHSFVAFGEMCQTLRVQNQYFFTKKSLLPDIPLFRPWDGLLRDGKTQFQRGDQWPKFPEVSIPAGETHVMSVQCDGLISFFEGTPFAVRIHLPKKQELFQFIANHYIKSMATWIPVPMDPSSAFNRDQSPWRPEWYLARLLNGTDVFPVFSSIASEFGLPTSVLSLGDFTYDRFIEGKEAGVGVSYSGLRYVMGDDFRANVRFQQCSQYPNGLVKIDATCVGAICKTLQLKQTCKGKGSCALGKCVSSHFYDNDIVASMLWGTDNDEMRRFGENWPGEVLCPTTEPRGYIGVRETNNSKLFQTAANVYALTIVDSCGGRPECSCELPTCQWNGNMCIPTGQINPALQHQEIELCVPRLIPFPRAFIQDVGYATGQIGKPNSSNIYTVSQSASLGRNVTVYGVNADVIVIGQAQMVNITVPDFSCASGGISAPGSDNNGDNDSGMSNGVVVAIVAAAVVGVAVVALSGMMFTKKGPFSAKDAHDYGTQLDPLN